MGWQSEVPSHEGWIANVLADGRMSSASYSGGVIIFGALAADGREERLPWDEVVAWRVMCECGWTGPSRPAFADAESGHRDCAEDIEDTVMLPAWEEHVAPYEAIRKLESVSAEIARLTRLAEELVDVARSGKISWAEIGRVTNLSKQGAQQRWGDNRRAVLEDHRRYNSTPG